MPVHPIEYRYGTREMKRVWSEESKLLYLLRVEVALATAEADLNVIPEAAAKQIAHAAEKVSVKRVREIEKSISHDVMAVVQAVSEQLNVDADYVHYGATSSDIIDTSLSLQLQDSLGILVPKLKKLRSVLVNLADENKLRVCAGRTHGQIAVPTTYGMRFAVWAMEIDRHLQRIWEARSRIEVGQITGAVGTQAAFGKRGVEVQARTLELLGLRPVEVSTQVIQRDRYAEYVMLLANLATTLEKMFTEIRTLQRSEIGEISEGFGKGQVGSSTMPHKRNPIKSEQICGLARVIRSFVIPALENNILWDERDLTNSSSERIIFPEVTILTDHIATLATNVLGNLQFHDSEIKRNLDLMGGLNMSEAVMIQLANKIGRQRAHEVVRLASMRAYESDETLVNALLKEPAVTEHLTKEQLEWMTRPENYIGTAVQQVESVVALLRQEKCLE
ncbi:MAG: adenylosuccinate lyase [Halobacteriota archaeon]